MLVEPYLRVRQPDASPRAELKRREPAFLDGAADALYGEPPPIGEHLGRYETVEFALFRDVRCHDRQRRLAEMGVEMWGRGTLRRYWGDGGGCGRRGRVPR